MVTISYCDVEDIIKEKVAKTRGNQRFLQKPPDIDTSVIEYRYWESISQ